MESKYKIKKELGRGASGKVYLIKKNNKYYALKKIFIKDMNKDEINKCKEEINILKNLNSEYIVKFHDAYQEKDYLCILMEYAGDSNLKTFIQNHSDQLIDEKIIKSIILQICIGLKEIHKANIIHRDLSPDNIFINADNKIKIGDFGISKKLEGNKYANSVVGKYEYFAPELMKGGKYDYRVDIYALGCIIYELFTLRSYFLDKFDGKVEKIDSEVYNKKWQDLIEKLLKKDYHERPDADKIYDYIINMNKSSGINMINEFILFLNDFDHYINEQYEKEIRLIKKEQINYISSLYNKGLITNIFPIKYKIEDKSVIGYKLISKNFSTVSNDWIPAWHGTPFRNLESIITYGLQLPGTKLKNGKITPKPSCFPENVYKIKNWENAIFATPCIDCAAIYSFEKKHWYFRFKDEYPYSPSLVEIRIKPKSYTKHRAKELVGYGGEMKGGPLTCDFPIEHNDYIYRITSEKDIIIKSILFFNPQYLTDLYARSLNEEILSKLNNLFIA